MLGNPVELRELLTNLVINAVDAMPSGGRITLHLRARDQFALIEVADSGTGMSEEAISRCFEPFYTTKGSAGTGLGLSVCHAVVKRHGGRMEIDSELGRGTTLRIYLPFSREEFLSIAETLKSSPACRRVLFIDDDPRVRPAIASMLQRLGQQVEVADSGAAGLALFCTKSYDLVITDLGMPELDGREVTRAVKTMRPDTPVIMLTGWGLHFAMHEIVQGAEPDYILRKPLTVSTLAEALEKVPVRTKA